MGPPTTGPAKRHRLSHTLVDELQSEIESGVLAAGERLPTERELCDRFGVSRTVVREAISGLRAGGLVEARQGSGVYVKAADDRPDTAAIFTGGTSDIVAILEFFELRQPIETEAAGLAAMRRSAGQEAAIRLAFEHFRSCILRGESTAAADFDLHMAIVVATNNRFYIDVLKFLGRKTIPRPMIVAEAGGDPRSYWEMVQEEHRRIVEAIGAQEPEEARAAMHAHLKSSHNRYMSQLRHDPAGSAGSKPKVG